MSLSEGPQGDPNGNVPDETGDARPNVPQPPHPPANPQTTNHFFHFDGEFNINQILRLLTVY